MKTNGYMILIVGLFIGIPVGMVINQYFPMSPLPCENSNFNNDAATSSISIISLDDQQIVHSKVVIDATLSADIKKIDIQINGKSKANYLPYVWNNIEEPVGSYNISIKGMDENNTIITETSKIIIIPELEYYTPANFTVKEDIVIHKGQTVYWSDGYYNLSISGLKNGFNSLPYSGVYLNIYGTLIISKCVVHEPDPSMGISIEQNGKMVLNNSTMDVDYICLFNNATLDIIGDTYITDHSICLMGSNVVNGNYYTIPR